MDAKSRREALIEEGRTADFERRNIIARALKRMHSVGEIRGKCLRCGLVQYRDDACAVLPHSLRIVCEPCQPTYADILETPEIWFNRREYPMSAEEAQSAADQHVANGGALTDKPGAALWYQGDGK